MKLDISEIDSFLLVEDDSSFGSLPCRECLLKVRVVNDAGFSHCRLIRPSQLVVDNSNGTISFPKLVTLIESASSAVVHNKTAGNIPDSLTTFITYRNQDNDSILIATSDELRYALSHYVSRDGTLELEAQILAKPLPVETQLEDVGATEVSELQKRLQHLVEKMEAVLEKFEDRIGSIVSSKVSQMVMIDSEEKTIENLFCTTREIHGDLNTLEELTCKKVDQCKIEQDKLPVQASFAAKKVPDETIVQNQVDNALLNSYTSVHSMLLPVHHIPFPGVPETTTQEQTPEELLVDEKGMMVPATIGAVKRQASSSSNETAVQEELWNTVPKAFRVPKKKLQAPSADLPREKELDKLLAFE